MSLGVDYLPSGYSSHNAMGEHALKHQGNVVEASYLRAKYLGLGDSPEERQAFQDDIDELQLGVNPDNLGDFVFVSPVDTMGQWLETCGYGISRFEILGNWTMKAVVEELVVDEEHRGQGIATWILRKLATQRDYSHFASPTMLSIKREGNDEFADRMAKKVFRRLDEGNNPTSWLPGDIRMIQGQYHREMLEKMPSDYTGVLEVLATCEEDETFHEIYRDGQKIAQIRHTGKVSEAGRGDIIFEVSICSSDSSYEVTGYGSDLYINALNHPVMIAETTS